MEEDKEQEVQAAEAQQGEDGVVKAHVDGQAEETQALEVHPEEAQEEVIVETRAIEVTVTEAEETISIILKTNFMS